jgi:hypothetical protein
MKISGAKKLILEEVPSEQRSWFTKIINVINPFFDSVYKILTNGITIGDNCKAQKITISIAANQVYPVEVAYTLNEKPYAVHVAQVREDNSTTQVVQNHSFNWYIENNVLKLYFAGLDSSKSYAVNLYTLI